MRELTKMSSRFHPDKPVSELKIKVIAENKDKCEKVRNKLSRMIKDDFLHEETIDKNTITSLDTKRKIAKVLLENNIVSIKGLFLYFNLIFTDILI